jgi:hypothetical protein
MEAEAEAAEEAAPVKTPVGAPGDDRFSKVLRGRDTGVARGSRMSRQVMQAFQANKFQNIRKVNEVKR